MVNGHKDAGANKSNHSVPVLNITKKYASLLARYVQTRDGFYDVTEDVLSRHSRVCKL